VDGHQIEHACHAVRDAKQARVPPGCIFALDLHQGLMHALDAHQGDGRRTHEIKAPWLNLWVERDLKRNIGREQFRRKGATVRVVICCGQERTPRTIHHGLVFASGSEPRSAGKENKQVRGWRL